MEVRIVAQLMSCLDDLKDSAEAVVVIGATSRPEKIDESLRREGRFERELKLGVPTEVQREEILRILMKPLRKREDFNMEKVLRHTPGYVGADLATLCKEASILAVERIVSQKDATNDSDSDTELQDVFIEVEDFMKAVKKVQPSARREGFSIVPNVSWKDVGALAEVRAQLQESIVDPIIYPKKFARIGLSAPAGVLLYGPPGCGKTLVAKAVSNESKANFISIKGPELLNKYVGESEKAVR